VAAQTVSTMTAENVPQSSFTRRLLALILLGRYYYLGGTFVLHMLGVVMALYTGAPLNVFAFFWGQIAIGAMQLMTHYSNDYFDLEADRANQTPSTFSGGSRILAAGELPAWAGLAAALFWGAVALIATFVLTFDGRSGPLTLPLLLLSLFLSWSYSAPPMRLHSRGLGELTVAIVVGLLVPMVGFYLQTGHLTALPFLVGLPLCALQFATIVGINFPDAEGDRAAGKDTLVIRLGPSAAARVFIGGLMVAYTLLLIGVLIGLPPLVAVIGALTSPIALWQGWRMAHGAWSQPEQWDSLGLWGFALVVLMSLAQIIAFLALIGRVLLT